MRRILIVGSALALTACQTSAAPSAPEAPSQQADTPTAAEVEAKSAADRALNNWLSESSAKWVKPDYPPTRVLDADRAETLLGNSGITLQWISWDWRGQAYVRWQDQTIVIDAEQNADKAPAGVKDLAPGSVYMKGYIEEVGPFHFIFNGMILIKNAPDEGRYCEREGPMEFRITQNRKYWRLQDIGGCGDGLADYVDIYF